MSWLDRLRFWRKDQENRYSMEDWLGWMGWQGVTYPLNQTKMTLGDEPMEQIQANFESQAVNAFGSNPVVYACEALRAHVFSAVTFQWQLLINGRAGQMFGTEQLSILERPWFGGTTQDLLNRMIIDGDLAGTCYLYKTRDLNNRPEILRLRPDWTYVIMTPRKVNGARLGWLREGYAYYEDGLHSGNDPVIFGPDELYVFTPNGVDPMANWRGQSWLTPVVREIEADGLMTRHRRKFFENGATPNMIVSYPVQVKSDQIEKFQKIMEAEHAGVDNAYKRVYLGGGADVTVVGSNFQEITFKETQGGGETRIAAAAGTPPVLVGLSEGLQGSSLNSGNYQQARRRMADITAHPLWANVSGTLGPLVGAPPPARTSGLDLGKRNTAAVRLWYDSRHVPFLREDEKDQAEITSIRSQAIRSLVDVGFDAESVKSAILSDDFSLLTHTGLFSVQLQPPMTPEDIAQQKQDQQNALKAPAPRGSLEITTGRHGSPGDKGYPAKHPGGAGGAGGSSESVVEGNLQAVVDRCKASGNYENDIAWYRTAHDQVGERAQAAGVAPDVFAGMVSATSPQCAWETKSGRLLNIDLAEKAAIAAKANPGMTGKQVAVAMKSPGMLRTSLANAVDIHNGAPADQVLKGPKTRSFYNNLINPNGTKHVTIDTHMARALAADPKLDNQGIKKFTSGKSYEWSADRVRKVAADNNISPADAQSVVWSQWKRENP